LFLDLDRFKLLNDTMGHSAGDELLIAVSSRLALCVPEDALVARVGGDEFLIMVPNVVDIESTLDLCERVRIAMEAPFPVRGTDMYTSASIGVTFTTGGELAVNAEAMIREADTAMYQAKDAGRNGISVFDAPMRDRVAERLTIERDLHLALGREELSLVFQPIMRLPAGPPEGVEALLRWNHPTRGLIGPSTFVPIAEESTLIIEIGNWVLQTAARQIAALRRADPAHANLYVSVNLSARQLRDPTLFQTVREILGDTGLPATALCLELTESLLIEERSATSVLRELRALGVKLAIDDFGTGYSSLSYVQRFPAETVKVDRSFVERLTRPDAPQQSLVAAIVAMASALGMEVIAEGVETPLQEAQLIQLGCHAAQGYFYAPPVKAEQLATTLVELGAGSNYAPDRS
jgi:diguanylate cyclase (GGDEF)-like protein